MKPMTLVDADSQFVVEYETPQPDWALPPEVQALYSARMIGFAHSVFGDHHNFFPISIREVLGKEAGLKALCTAIKKVTVSEFGRPPDLILYPTESTAGAVVERVAHAYGAKRPQTLALSPAYRRWNQSVLKLEATMEDRAIFSLGGLFVLFFDDSISSGETEQRAIAELRNLFLGDLRWVTYTIINRGVSSHSAQPNRRKRARRKAGDSYHRTAYVKVGPISLDGFHCPLCRAAHRVDISLEWAIAARPAITDRLKALKLSLEQYNLDTNRPACPIVPPDVEVALLALASMSLEQACLMLLDRTPCTHDQDLAKLVYLALNFTDVCAYLAQDHIFRLFAQAVQAVSNDASEYGNTLLLALTLIPLDAARRLLPVILPHLIRTESLGQIGALFALQISNHHNLFRIAHRRGHLGEARANTLQEKFLLEALVQIDRVVANLPDQGQVFRQAIISDLDLLKHRPEAHDQLWHVRVLAALLHSGEHLTFLWKELRSEKVGNIESVRTNLLHTLGLLVQLFEQLAPGKEQSVQDDMKFIREAASWDDLRQAGLNCLEIYWRRYVETEFIYDPHSLETQLNVTRIKALRQLNQHARGAASTLRSRFKLLPVPRTLKIWTVFGPDYRYLQEHFENMFVHAIKHFTGNVAEDWPAIFSRLHQDQRFQDGRPLLWVSYHVDQERESFYIAFSDRAAPPVRGKLLSQYSGLASCRAHLQIKGGDIIHFLRGDPDPVVARIETALTGAGVDLSLINNHFVTRLPLILSYKAQSGAPS